METYDIALLYQTVYSNLHFCAQGSTHLCLHVNYVGGGHGMVFLGGRAA